MLPALVDSTTISHIEVDQAITTKYNLNKEAEVTLVDLMLFRNLSDWTVTHRKFRPFFILTHDLLDPCFILKMRLSIFNLV